jgi:hypothetical protein
MSWELEAIKNIWNWMCKHLGKPLAGLIVVAGCLIYFTNKFGENIKLHSKSSSFLVTMRADEIHKIDSARGEVKEVRMVLCDMKQDIIDLRTLIIQVNRDIVTQTGNQIDYAVRYSGQNKDMIIEAMRDIRSAYLNKIDTINYKIGVDKK